MRHLAITLVLADGSRPNFAGRGYRWFCKQDTPPNAPTQDSAVWLDPANPGRVDLVLPDAATDTPAYNWAIAIDGFKLYTFRSNLWPIGYSENGAPTAYTDPFPLAPLEPSVGPFPSRLDAINVRTYFQGLWVRSNAYSARYQAQYGGDGSIPFFGASIQDFAVAGDLDQILDQLLGADPPATHVMIDLDSGPPGYNEAGQPYGSDQLIAPADFVSNPDAALPIIDRVIERGMMPVYLLDGEGGPDWIYRNLPAWVARLGPARVRRGPFQVVFDGAWPATWTVADMQTMIPWMRQHIGPDGFLGFMFADDYLWVVNEQDYTQPWMDGLDYVATSNGPDSATCPSLANKALYMLRNPQFDAANCHPDQGGVFVLADCSRGPRSWSEQEYATYQTTRDPWQVWKPFCDAARARCIALGCASWG